MASLPPLSQVSSQLTTDSPLINILSILFEPSPVLFEKLVPELSSPTLSFDTYSSLIDVSMSMISSWDPRSKAAFIAGHPRIGEVKNLSHLSQREQAAIATPPTVLSRLARLNFLYEKRYPGLRYITFVNGRSRAAIKDEMENMLGLSHDGGSIEPEIDRENITPVQVGSREWLEELDRAIDDVGRIAKSRLSALGVA